MALKTAFNPFTSNFDVISEIELDVVGNSPNSEGATLTDQVLNLEPADGSNPGVVSTTDQTFAGDKTFNGDTIFSGLATASSTLFANGGIETITNGTLNIGTSSPDIINIGRSGAAVNIQGNTFYQNVTNLQVADKLVTLNVGGSAGSGSTSGIEIEENSIITGYAETSGDRNSWTFKAPNTAGVAIITPGSGGITLDQSSHDPVTLNTIGGSPNNSGASLSGQVLTLQPADATHPGLLSAATQTIGGAKTFSSTVTSNGVVVGASANNISGLSTLNSGLGALTLPVAIDTLVGKSTSDTFSNKVIDTASSNTIKINGNTLSSSAGTATITIPNSTDTLVGRTTTDTLINKSISLSSNTITGTANRAAQFNSGTGALEASSVTDTELGFVSGVTSSIQTQLNNKVTKSTGDIDQTSFSAANNQSAAADVTGLAFANASVRSFEALVSVTLLASSNLYESFKLYGIQRGSSWSLSQTSVGDISGFVFSITNAGQIQYVSPNAAGFTSATIKFRAQTLAV